MVKTFQLHFSEEELEKIGKKAQELGMSKKTFIMKAIEQKLKEGNNDVEETKSI